MELILSPTDSKESVFSKVGNYLGDLLLDIESVDSQRPWGGFFVIDTNAIDKFITSYFPDLNRAQIKKYGGQLSPKILVVEPGQKLSWQYHNRRAELWRVVDGPVGVITSNSDDEGAVETMERGQTVQFDASVRHRLVGLENWGIVAEIWQHTEAENPSDENDIVRLNDAYGRSS